MKRLIKNVFYFACLALLGLGLAYLMFDVKTSAYSVLGAVFGVLVGILISLLFQPRVARRT